MTLLVDQDANLSVLFQCHANLLSTMMITDLHSETVSQTPIEYVVTVSLNSHRTVMKIIALVSVSIKTS